MKDIVVFVTVIILSFINKHAEAEIYDYYHPRNGGLFLTPIIKNATFGPSIARNEAAVDINFTLGIPSYAGFITVNETYNSNLFFWFFPVDQMENKPWIIWLQGGPGASSMIGQFKLIGPLNYADGILQRRSPELTWASGYSLLFLDNPVGAGFSFTQDQRGYTTNEEQVGSQMYIFLQQFLDMFPELRLAPLFIAGQSYAGKYVPALAIQLHRHRNMGMPINLKGLIIGNGLTDPRSMMTHYHEMCRVFGILSEEELAKLAWMERTTVELIDRKKFVDASNKFNESMEFIKKRSGLSLYNVLNVAKSSPFEFEEFLSRQDVKDHLHVGESTFELNNQVVYHAMLGDIMDSTKNWVEELLNNNYGVLYYSGQLDIIIAYYVTTFYYNNLMWSGRREYQEARRVQLLKNGEVYGYKKSGGNFTDVLIRNAGHMVPADKPLEIRNVIDRFIEKYK